MKPDNLDDAQRLVDKTAAGSYAPAGFQAAIALALIDIGRSLRDIRDEMRDWDTYGLPVKNKVG